MAARRGATACWRALGFASVEDDDVSFTDGDLDALAKVKELTLSAPVDDEMLHAMTRVLGQTFSRLAAWQGQMVLELIVDSPELHGPALKRLSTWSITSSTSSVT